MQAGNFFIEKRENFFYHASLAIIPQMLVLCTISRILYFETNSKLKVIYLPHPLPERSSGTFRHIAETRPCTRVRILPFHLQHCCRSSSLDNARDALPFRVKASLLAPLGLPGRALPATLYFPIHTNREECSHFPP